MPNCITKSVTCLTFTFSLLFQFYLLFLPLNCLFLEFACLEVHVYHGIAWLFYVAIENTSNHFMELQVYVKKNKKQVYYDIKTMDVLLCLRKPKLKKI